MSDIYLNKCVNPLCEKQTTNPRYCSLSCSSIHNAIIFRNKKIIEYNNNPKLCARAGCNEIIKFESRNSAKYCSHNCSAMVNNKGRVRNITEDFRIKMRNIAKRKDFSFQICQVCSVNFYRKKNRKTCSKACTNKLISAKIKDYIKKTPSHKYNRTPIKQSWMESSFEKWLNEHNIKRGLKGYLTEVRFYNPNTKKNGKADFIFPKLKLMIELDGSQHLHRKELDNIRDDYLKKRGWNVVRISYSEYKKRSKITEIKNLLHL